MRTGMSSPCRRPREEEEDFVVPMPFIETLPTAIPREDEINRCQDDLHDTTLSVVLRRCNVRSWMTKRTASKMAQKDQKQPGAAFMSRYEIVTTTTTI